MDVWSAGIIMYSLLARRYPLLEMPGAEKGDDYDLAMTVSLIGETKMAEAARALGACRARAGAALAAPANNVCRAGKVLRFDTGGTIVDHRGFVARHARTLRW